MKLRCWALALLVAGCEADTSGLDGTGSGRDAGVGLDVVSPSDAGPVDAGGPGDAGRPDAGPALCPAGRTFGLQLEDRADLDLEGEVEVISTSPLVLVPAANAPLTLQLFGEAPVGWARPGERLYARIEARAPWWTEVRVAFWGLGPAGGPAELRLMAWSGSAFGAGAAGAVRYGYAPADCEIPDESCGPQRAETLSVELDGAALSVGRGERASAGPYQVLNGGSATYIDPPRCTDTPDRWYAGWIAVELLVPGDCSTLARDDCIIDPRCVLWGSETEDPGYLCLPAETPCEAQASLEQCVAAGACAWDPGRCYCPEDRECACGGGPAPKCRDLCGGFGGATCAPGRFCDLDITPAPACASSPDDGGECELVPRSCAGSPTGPVCACASAEPGGPSTFDNDCLRRQALASGERAGACS